MHHLWVIVVSLCLLLHGSVGLMIHNAADNLCLQDSSTTEGSPGVKLCRCNLDDDLQQWAWQDQRFLRNVGTQRCLSAFRERPLVMEACDGAEHLAWGCEAQGGLLSLNRSLWLGAHKGRLRLLPAPEGLATRWKSLDKYDVCQERVRSKRAWEEDGFGGELEEDEPAVSSMNQEQREFLKWFYRTEDQTKWTFAMLALAFGALLLGCILLVSGMMASRSRKKIAKYKAVAAQALKASPGGHELREVVSEATQQLLPPPSPELQAPSAPVAAVTVTPDNHVPAAAPTPAENGLLKPGEIMVTWRDGTVSNLYGDRGAKEEEEKRGVEEEKGGVEEEKGAVEEKGGVEEERGAVEEEKREVEEEERGGVEEEERGGPAEEERGVEEERGGVEEEERGAEEEKVEEVVAVAAEEEGAAPEGEEEVAKAEEVTVAEEEVAVAGEEVAIAGEEVAIAEEEVTIAGEEVTVAEEEVAEEVVKQEVVKQEVAGEEN
ncbi:solute carrier family 51 subunit beta [Engraulis encrasicolus]|uniref:solute carrier family 51 subunit beta n=1 Tax=Engraulis encrasicolus TaxID=184585 RepID=UPI002FCE7F2D